MMDYQLLRDQVTTNVQRRKVRERDFNSQQFALQTTLTPLSPTYLAAYLPLIWQYKVNHPAVPIMHPLFLIPGGIPKTAPAFLK